MHIAFPRKRLLIAFKVLVTVGLLSFLASQIDYSQMQSVLGSAHWQLLALGLALHAFAFVLSALRWWWLFRHVQPDARFTDVAGAFYLGIFANNFLPTAVGGDVIRTLKLRADGYATDGLLSSAFVDRLAGLIGVLVMGGTALLLSDQITLPDQAQYLLLSFVVATPIMVALLFWSKMERWLIDHVRPRVEQYCSLNLVLETLLRINRYRNAWRRVFGAIALTIALQSLIVLAYAAYGNAIGMTLALSAYFVAVPIIFLTVNLPISIGGYGVREGVAVGMFVAFGATGQHAIAVSLLFLGSLLLVTLPGGLLLINSKFTRDDIAKLDEPGAL